jgi:integrase
MNSEKDMASTLTGLNKRGSRWYVLILIPPDLQEVYGKARVNLALNTSDKREATLLGTIKRAEWLAEFAIKRRILKPETLAVVTPELAKELALRIHAKALRQDDRIRDDPAVLQPLLDVVAQSTRSIGSGLMIPGGPRPQIPPSPATQEGGLSDDAATVLAGLNALMNEQAGADLAKRRRAAILPLVRLEALELGLAFNPDAEGAQEALLGCLMAYRKARQQISERDEGEIVETPEMPQHSPLSATSNSVEKKTLCDVYERWQQSGDKPKSADSISAYGRAVRQFEEKHPDTLLKDITTEMGDSYRAWLRETCKTPKTARDRLTAIKSLQKYAFKTLKWIPERPWEGLDIKARTTSPRRPWRDAELTALFSTPLHTAYKLPRERQAGKEAAYWIPLIGLFTGARLGEVCQLRTDDIQEEDGIPIVVLTDDGEGQKIKSESGHRHVPIHSELIRLGFLGYVAAVRASGSGSLWPDMPVRKDKPSDYFGRWFKSHRELAGLTGEDSPTFHYFRHTVRPLMRRAGFSESTLDKITGHKTMGSVGTTTYDHWMLTEMKAAVEAIAFPKLTFPMVSPHGATPT